MNLHLPAGTLTKTRFAPSPTGYLHLGHIVSALYVWGVARLHGASVLVRIEDHDQQRSKPLFAEAILEDLHWLGLVNKETPIFYQSQQTARYHQALQVLKDKELVYGCACTRPIILAANKGRSEGEELVYNGRCRSAPGYPNLEHPHVVRYRLTEESVLFIDRLCGQQVQTPISQCGDVIVIDGKKNFSYHLANVVDDLVDGVDLIIRGEDILSSTGRQILLRRSLAPLSKDPAYYHHPLLYEENGKGKLSKRHQSVAIGRRREEGEAPAAVFGDALFQLGFITQRKAVELEQALAIIRDHC